MKKITTFILLIFPLIINAQNFNVDFSKTKNGSSGLQYLQDGEVLINNSFSSRIGFEITESNLTLYKLNEEFEVILEKKFRGFEIGNDNVVPLWLFGVLY